MKLLNYKHKYLEEIKNRKVQMILDRMQDNIVQNTTYFNIQTQKNPLDFWIYQEIIFKSHPEYIIEIGNFHGGSTLALAHICDNLNHGKIIAIDIDHSKIDKQVINHNRIELITGDAISVFEKVANLINNSKNVLVIEDSSHTYYNTLNILKKYSQLIPLNGYFIIEDTICHHGLKVGPKPGPFEAVEDFLEKNKTFVSDRSMERYVITWNPKGYLRRVK